MALFARQRRKTRIASRWHRIGFYKRQVTDDEYGNVRTEFSSTPEFVCFAAVVPKFQGEDVQGQRLVGTQTFTITVRQSSRTSQITTAWMAKDEREGTVFNIRSGPLDPNDDGEDYEFLCQSGVAT